MKKLTYSELREMWLGYLADKGHTVIPSASVVPENDPTTLFTTAGMQPLVPYLLGQSHPGGKRIADIQRCIRTNDIDEVGDASHCTFFEMMGNWSLGDYFKKEKVAWSYEFLTSPKYLGLPADKIHVTCFQGDAVAPKDTECAEFWEQQGVAKERIHFLPKSENWWALASGLGPQGPCSEMFYDSGHGCGKPDCNPSCDCGRFTELGNDVYMQYVAETVGVMQPAKQKNVDTGWGFERILCFVNGYKSVYETECFAPAIDLIKGAEPKTDVQVIVSPDFPDVLKDAMKLDKVKNYRIIAEHTRAASVIIADGVVPSNTGAGYVLRRLIRRAVRSANSLRLPDGIYKKLIAFYNSYLEFDASAVTEVFMKEVAKFEQTLAKGIKEFRKIADSGQAIDGAAAFHLYETYGFPIELTAEMAREYEVVIDIAGFERAKREHTEASRSASAAAGEFKGGLADSGTETVRLHTCAHILLAVLRNNFGDTVIQRGANITPERLRFDFSFSRKLEPDEIAKIEKQVNDIISRNLDVTCEEMPLAEAKASGACGTFSDRYGDTVKVYTIGSGASVVSREICGGPHVANTGELGVFKIQKEESVGTGIRRVKAILTK